MTSFFSAEGGQIWIKFRRLVQNDMSTAVIWSKSKPDVDFQYGGRFGESHVISEPPATLQGATTCRIQCHDPRATCYIAGCCHLAKSMSWSCHFRGCNNSISHIENRFSPYFILFLFFLMQFGLWRSAAFVSSPIHLLITAYNGPFPDHQSLIDR